MCEAHGLIGMSISTDLWFHISGIDEPDKAWEKLESMFGKHSEIQGHQLENELISLNPSDFSYIQDYLSKYTTLRLLWEECKIKKEDKQCIYHILSKLGPAYSIFVSTFYSMKESLTAASYQEPSLESFCDSLIREQDKLIHLEIINNADTSEKVLLSQQKEKSKPPKKQNSRNNKPNNKGPKPS